MVQEGVLAVCVGALPFRARLRFRGYVRDGLV